jgi:hypothetical protein
VRTTLTLDEDVARKLKRRVRETGKTFKDVVNEALRQSLLEGHSVKPQKGFVIPVLEYGPKPGVDYDNIGKLLDEMEEP